MCVALSVVITVWCTFDRAGRSWVKMERFQRSMKDGETKYHYKRSGSHRPNWRQRYTVNSYILLLVNYNFFFLLNSEKLWGLTRTHGTIGVKSSSAVWVDRINIRFISFFYYKLLLCYCNIMLAPSFTYCTSNWLLTCIIILLLLLLICMLKGFLFGDCSTIDRLFPRSRSRSNRHCSRSRSTQEAAEEAAADARHPSIHSIISN